MGGCVDVLFNGIGVEINNQEQQVECRTVSYLVSAIANICAASPNMIIDQLTGLLWDEEEAGKIKIANMSDNALED